MSEFLLASWLCFFYGTLISLHPCPLATNLAAISMLSSWKSKGRSFLVGLYFILGYVAAFICLGILLSYGGVKITQLNQFLQNILKLFLGPILILVGMLHSNLIKLNTLPGDKIIKWAQKRKWRSGHAFPMGFILALSFCPATAGLFFGLLFPLAVQHEQIFLFPFLFGFGAALPLLVIALFLRKSAATINSGKIWKNTLPKASGYLLILIGVYISVKEIYLS